ncbi:hypothetical protein HYPSUDRAFT_55504 [Hypholoma sublateritium FD-334 SS-4]|uniref:Sorbose reductase sou1 n=1 Tax=Hypholoma sublateritium (strain FD-334 SS-4) TaxID=945553 RepID=A0A0D2L3P5_HYPSF|nr:hypothetical protein HYPSUDRAFT_55504 [Hypholoma sublateritium FD-334 SS-4]
MTSHQGQPCVSGVNAVLTDAKNICSSLHLFSMAGRVAAITGGHRGIGLEMALAYAEAGAVVYCIDLPAQPDADFCTVQARIAALPTAHGQSTQAHSTGRLEYVACDVTKQKQVWDVMEQIAAKEGKLDVCIACAGILRGAEVLDYPGDEFQKIMEVNVNGVLFAAQGAGRMMVKHNVPGSIILIASMSGSIANKDMHWTAYNTSKAALIQMARSIACELGPKKIRCNSISPGYVYTEMTKAFLGVNPDLKEKWCSQNALGRLANPEEMCGAALFLGSDASTFCTGSDLIIDGGHRAW